MKIPKKKIREKWRKEDGTFGPGNPGKPEGAISHKTKFINRILNSFGEKEFKFFQDQLRSKRDWKCAMDRLIRVAEIQGVFDNDGSAEQMPQMRIIIEGSNDTTKPMATEKKPG